MKKIVSLITVIAMLAVSTPAIAGSRGHDYRWGVDHNGRQHSVNHRGNHRRDRGVSTGEAVAIGIGALILGAAISNSNRNARVERYEQPVQRRQSQYVCQDVIQHDYYGNPYVVDRNCRYQ